MPAKLETTMKTAMPVVTRRARVLPGHMILTDRSHVCLETILGSCIAACVRDPTTGRGGMNHFLLPGSRTRDGPERLSYGWPAMDALLREVTAFGCSLAALEIKLFGGAELTVTRHGAGAENVNFIRRYVERHKLSVLAEDLGGRRARRLLYHPASGIARRLFLRDPPVPNEPGTKRTRHRTNQAGRPALRR